SLMLASCGQASDNSVTSAEPARKPNRTPAAATPGEGAVAASASPAPVSGDERAGALHALGLKFASAGQVMNACDEAISPDIHAVELGGEVGRALLVVMKGGPNTASCYGMTGMEFHLMKQKGRVLTVILTGAGHVAPMESAHLGVKDIAVGGPGFEFPVYEWTGATYESTRTIPDSEFPVSIN
ncbi:MAG: hypothetical protein ABL957_13380, partial [Parvularculaceae bacterium]